MQTLAVITLPVLAPIAALLQLLFPGLLAEQWRHYRIAITVLLTQSTLFMLHWMAVTWWEVSRAWWNSDTALTISMILVAAVGLAFAIRAMMRKRSTRTQAAQPIELPADDPLVALLTDAKADPVIARRRIVPVKVEFFALGIFAALGVVWFIYQALAAGAPWDPVAPVTAACVIGVGHLLYRKSLAAKVGAAPSTATVAPHHIGRGATSLRITTELVILLSLTLSGAAIAFYVNQGPPVNQDAGTITYDWPTYRGNKHRTGVADDQPAPRAPVILWSFDPGERKGKVMIHSAPAVVDGLIFVGALHQVLFADGYVYCINGKHEIADPTNSTNVRPAVNASGQTTGFVISPSAFKPGELIWRFSAEGTAQATKAVFCSPTVFAGKLYFGEGYHEDTDCRLFCVDARSGKIEWAFPTKSHTESSPTIVAGRIFFGAGDDGVYCVDGATLEAGAEGEPRKPRLVWRRPNLHVDTAPAVADGRVFISTVIGDVHSNLAIAALDADTGDVIWLKETPLPVPGSPSHDAGRVYFGLGTGKLGVDPVDRAGAVWCVDAATGNRIWEYKTADGVFNSPVLRDGRVYFGCRDWHVYCLDARTGDFIWKRDVGDAVVTAPVVTKDDVIVVTVSGLIKCLVAADGSPRWSMDDLRTPDRDAYASPVLSGGRLYIAVGGRVHCIGEKGKAGD